MSQVDNFYQIRDVLIVIDLLAEMTKLGMHQADNIRIFNVDQNGRVGNYRFEGDVLNSRPGFYVFCDGVPVNHEHSEMKSVRLAADDILSNIIEMYRINRGLKEYERIIKPIAEVNDGFGSARLFASGVVVLSNKTTENLVNRNQDAEGGPVPQEVIDQLRRLLNIRYPL
jgi:hypothetical protein